MKKVLMVTILALVGLCGCTQYNGHIGPIFGSWALVEISNDGAPLEMKDKTVFSFQNEVIQVTLVNEEPLASTIRYGNFVKTDDTLTLKFQTKPTEGDTHMYMTPDWIYFPLDVNSILMDIKKLNGKEMILVLETGPTPLQYKFERTW